ncbi:MAG: N-acetyltransferase, partial [candidate division Zixibacteria bacterium]|nr:N-acetyltransferase [candidate division Zixibacteria bacterium]
MGAIEVTPVTSDADKKLFLRLPERLYAGNPHWVCPLRIERREFFDPAKNPFFDNADVQLFIARRDGRCVGRITAHIYRNHNQTHNERTGFFGFFECEQDYAIAEALYQKAAAYLKERGMDRMRGPANFTTNHEIAFLTEGFDSPPWVMMSYNPPFYLEFAERYGLTKAMDFNAYYMDKTMQIPDRIVRLIERIRTRSGATIRTLNMSKFDDEVRLVKSVYDRAWAPNWGFVPMTNAEFFRMAKDLKQIVDPKMVFFAEIDGETAGFSLALPDINQALIRMNGRLFPFGLAKLLWLTKVSKVVNQVRMLVMGVLPEYQKRGIDNLLFHETYTKGIEAGYVAAELSWILETNDMMNAAARNMG